MEKVLVLYMVFPLWLIILFQPYLNDIEDGRDRVAQVALERATEKAALEGYYTTDIIMEMNSILEKVGYSADDIEFTGTTDVTTRGQYITGTLKVPDKYSFLLFTHLLERKSNESNFHVNTATRMSEYIE